MESEFNLEIYPSLFAYLNRCQAVKSTTDIHIQARDRPIIIANLASEPFLVHLMAEAYEIAFPYLKPQDVVQHIEQLEHTLSIGSCSNTVRVADEVLDAAAIKSEEQLNEWLEQLGNRLDNQVTRLLQVLIGVFSELFNKKSEIQLLQLNDKLAQVNVAEATKPLIISLSERYELQRKLEAIAPKLRHQLRRQAELMPVGRIQEMDASCLRDYIRRPGRTVAQKAGSKQELMGVQRYQDYNTAENKFLVYFADKVLHLECYRYERSSATQYQSQVRRFRHLIDNFKQHPAVQSIQASKYHQATPNYVLQQNPIYSSFYRANQDYIRKKSEKEQLWSFRNQLLADTIYICLLAALTQFQGVGVNPLSKIGCHSSSDKGRYLKASEPVPEVRVFLQDRVYVFRLRKPTTDEPVCDWLLTAEIHQLNEVNAAPTLARQENVDSEKLETEKLELLIWVFWYCPTPAAIAQAEEYLQNLSSQQAALLLYLQVSPGETANSSINPPWLRQLPDPIAGGFSPIVHFMAKELQQWMSRYSGHNCNR